MYQRRVQVGIPVACGTDYGASLVISQSPALNHQWMMTDCWQQPVRQNSPLGHAPWQAKPHAWCPIGQICPPHDAPPPVLVGIPHPLAFNVQLALHVSVPVLLTSPVTLMHVAPPRSLPSHWSVPFLTLSPQMGAAVLPPVPVGGVRTQLLAFTVQLTLHVSVPVLDGDPVTLTHVAPPRSWPSHCSVLSLRLFPHSAAPDVPPAPVDDIPPEPAGFVGT